MQVLSARGLGPAALLAVSTSLCTSLAEAQESPPPAVADPVTLETVIVQGTLPSEVQDTPGAGTRLSAELISERKPYSLHEALDFAPGVHAQDDDAAGRRSGIGVRGAPPRRSRKTLLLEDGVPINAAPYLDASGHYTPPTQRLESVDVLKGAGHVLFGPLNNHGIVNFRNKRPTEEPSTTAELAAGNQGGFLRHAMHQRTDGRLGTVISYTGLDADGTFDVEDTRFDDYFLSLDRKLGDQQQIGASVTYFRERSHYDESNLTPIEYQLAPRRKRERFAQEFNTIAVDYTKIDVHHQLSREAFSLSSRIYATELDRPRFTVDPDEILVDALPEFVYVDEAYRFVPGVSGVMISRSREYRMLGGDTRATFESGAHRWSFGIQASRGFLDDANSFGDIGEVLSEGNRGRYSGENELAEAELATYQSTAVAGYVEDAIRRGPWTLTPGLRVERYSVQKSLRFEGDEIFNQSEKDENTLVLPSVALLYSGQDNTQVFFNLARGYTPAFARTAEEFPLEPETGINSQIGFRRVLVSGLRMEAAAYYNLIDNTIVQLPFTVNDNNVVLNSEDSEAIGFDLGLVYEAPAFAGGIRPFGELAFGYVDTTFTSGEVSGNQVPGVPEQFGSLSAGLRGGEVWQLSVTINHFGRYYSDLLNTEGLVLADEDREPIEPGDEIEIREVVVLGAVPSNTLLSARASVKLPTTKAQTELWVSGRNLTDKLYISDLENGIRPGAERTWLAGLSVQF